MKNKWIVALLVVTVMLAAGGIMFYLVVGSPDESWIVTINGENISESEFKAELAKLNPDYQEIIKEDPDKFMEGIVSQTLLLQQAKKEGFVPTGPGNVKTATILAYLEKQMASLPPIGAKEVDLFYEQHKDRMGGRKKTEAAPVIKQMLETQQRDELVQKLVTELRQRAKIDVNQKALRKLATVVAEAVTQSEGDFRKALSGGKPTVVDFGANSCIPCRQLRPVLQKIRQTYAGKLEVLVIDIRHNKKLADDYKIQVIPTVVFFDRTGKEIFRHQGFMSEEKMKDQLVQMGVI